MILNPPMNRQFLSGWTAVGYFLEKGYSERVIFTLLANNSKKSAPHATNLGNFYFSSLGDDAIGCDLVNLLDALETASVTRRANRLGSG